VLFNGNILKKNTIGVEWAELGWGIDGSSANVSVLVRDLWQQKDLGVIQGGYKATLSARDQIYLRLTLHQ